MELVRVVIGVFINLEIWIFLTLNILCLVCMWRGRFYANQDNPAYLITTFNLLSESGQLAFHGFYVGPSILLGDWLFAGGQDSFGVTIMALFFFGILVTLDNWGQSFKFLLFYIMKKLRLAVVFFPNRKIFTLRRLYYIMGVMIIVALCLMTFSQLLSPCCRVTPDFHFYSYSYFFFENQTENLSLYFVDGPLDFSTSVICATSYCALFVYVYGMAKGEVGYRKREIKLCFQFLLMFLAYTVAWTSFFILSILEINVKEVYMITCINVVANCGMNGVIYLAINAEVKFELKKLIGTVSPTATFGSTGASKNASPASKTQNDISQPTY